MIARAIVTVGMVDEAVAQTLERWFACARAKVAGQANRAARACRPITPANPDAAVVPVAFLSSSWLAPAWNGRTITICLLPHLSDLPQIGDGDPPSSDKGFGRCFRVAGSS